MLGGTHAPDHLQRHNFPTPGCPVGDTTTKGHPPGQQRGVRPVGLEVVAAPAVRIHERECKLRWPKDYSQRVYCEERERVVVHQLREPIYAVPSRVADAIRAQCANQWPKDFGQRLYCQERQIRAAKELKNP
jgi:hypothetical protein